MNFIAKTLLALALFAQTASAIDFTRVQAGRISWAVGQLLEHVHYTQKPFDNEVSQAFLKSYLNALDYNHLLFLQTDVDEFTERYARSLDEATMSGDVKPAYTIFDRYLERLTERHRAVEKMLLEKFDFTEDESFLVNRNKAPWPKDAAEAEKLWKARLKYELLQGKLNKEKPEETLKLISRRYARLEKTMREFDSEEILQTYLTSLAHVYDPHSDYMSPTEAANFEINNISLSLTGIGAQLEWDDGYTKIKALIPGGPAELSKQLKPNDKIVAVAQGEEEPVDTVEMRLNKVVGMIRGKRGTEVRLTIIPANSPDGSVKKVITLIRNEIKLKEQFAKAKIVETKTADGQVERLGVVNLPQFYDNCAEHVEKLVTRLKAENVTGIVLDLRHNGGGILDEAVRLTGLFIKKGPVVQVKDHRKQTTVLEDKDGKVAYDGPLIVLVGRLSASASEITAAALQDYGRALIVGDQATHGKGTVQQVLALDQMMRSESVPNPGKLKITVSKFYRIAGGTTQKQGVTPEIVLPSVYDYLDLGESSLEHALAADNTTPLTYPHLERVKPYVADLTAKHKARIQDNKDFVYLNEDIEQVKKRQEEKTISLNEKKRLDEKAESKARLETRKKERASRKTPADRTFEVDIETVDANKPLTLFVPGAKSKEAEELAAAPTPNPDGETETDVEPPTDAQLDETLRILNDYAGLLKKSADSVGSDKVAKTK